MSAPDVETIVTWNKPTYEKYRHQRLTVQAPRGTLSLVPLHFTDPHAESVTFKLFFSRGGVNGLLGFSPTTPPHQLPEYRIGKPLRASYDDDANWWWHHDAFLYPVDGLSHATDDVNGVYSVTLFRTKDTTRVIFCHEDEVIRPAAAIDARIYEFTMPSSYSLGVVLFDGNTCRLGPQPSPDEEAKEIQQEMESLRAENLELRSKVLKCVDPVIPTSGVIQMMELEDCISIMPKKRFELGTITKNGTCVRYHC
eukprot:PhF_6_TR40351/c0_g1_i2/m.60034